MEWFYLINLVLVFVSWRWATVAFEENNTFGGWLNVVASAMNAAAVATHFF